MNGTIQLQNALVAVLVTSEVFGQVRRYGSEFHRREDAEKSIALLSLDEVAPRGASSNELLRASELRFEAQTSPIDVRVTAGTKLLITGASGSGKTRLLHTLLGWRRPVSGEILLSATSIGFVSPDSALLSGSLWQNVTLGAHHDMSVVAALLSDLGLDSDRFGDLEGVLLADGRGISSGERVRIVLARALLAGSQLIVLDDIAGVLDQESRKSVQNVLNTFSNTAIIEATVDTPILTDVTNRLEVRS